MNTSRCLAALGLSAALSLSVSAEAEGAAADELFRELVEEEELGALEPLFSDGFESGNASVWNPGSCIGPRLCHHFNSPHPGPATAFLGDLA